MSRDGATITTRTPTFAAFCAVVSARAPGPVRRRREHEDDDVRRHHARDRLDVLRPRQAIDGEPRPLEVQVKRDRDVGVLPHHENARRHWGACGSRGAASRLHHDPALEVGAVRRVGERRVERDPLRLVQPVQVLVEAVHAEVGARPSPCSP